MLISPQTQALERSERAADRADREPLPAIEWIVAGRAGGRSDHFPAGPPGVQEPEANFRRNRLGTLAKRAERQDDARVDRQHVLVLRPVEPAASVPVRAADVAVVKLGYAEAR